ncbi:MAG: methyltransferase domain-containing protein [Myxococcales bacterium]|nr:methyltransferase domain-containing protein [Myxococcales bacterium]
MERPGDTAAHFSRLAERYAASESHAAGDDLAIVRAFAAPRASDRHLDVATGAGHTALRIAPDVALTVASDVAPGMLASARRLAEGRGLANLRTLFADAARLPFRDGSLDLVTCRIAPHHFPDLGAFLAETARVLAPGGRAVIEDSLAPDDRAERAFLHEIEARRDPTHLRSLTRGEWRESFLSAGLRVIDEKVHHLSRGYDAWMERSGLAQAEIAELSDRILATDEPVRAPFFRVESGRITRFVDDKLIVRLERA